MVSFLPSLTLSLLSGVLTVNANVPEIYVLLSNLDKLEQRSCFPCVLGASSEVGTGAGRVGTQDSLQT